MSTYLVEIAIFGHRSQVLVRCSHLCLCRAVRLRVDKTAREVLQANIDWGRIHESNFHPLRRAMQRGLVILKHCPAGEVESVSTEPVT